MLSGLSKEMNMLCVDVRRTQADISVSETVATMHHITPIHCAAR